MINYNTKFLILSPPRVGSQVLKDSLNSYNSITLNEIFTHRKYYTQYPNINKKYKNPIKYINYFLDKQPQLIKGAKILVPSFPKHALTKIMQYKPFKFIYAFRLNILENVFSLLIVRRTKQWSLYNYEKPANLKKFIASDTEVQNTIQRIMSCNIQCITQLKKLNCNYKLCVYENMIKNNQINLKYINKIRQFLGISLAYNIHTPYIKQNSNAQYNRIINRAEIEQKFGPTYGYLNGRQHTPKIWSELNIF